MCQIQQGEVDPRRWSVNQDRRELLLVFSCKWARLTCVLCLTACVTQVRLIMGGGAKHSDDFKLKNRPPAGKSFLFGGCQQGHRSKFHKVSRGLARNERAVFIWGERLSASQSIVQLSGYINPLFFSLSPSPSQTKASCRESFSMLVSGSCGQSVTRAKRVWPARDGNRHRAIRALEPSATSRFRERDGGWKERGRKSAGRQWERNAANSDRRRDRENQRVRKGNKTKVGAEKREGLQSEGAEEERRAQWWANCSAVTQSWSLRRIWYIKKLTGWKS